MLPEPQMSLHEWITPARPQGINNGASGLLKGLSAVCIRPLIHRMIISPKEQSQDDFFTGCPHKLMSINVFMLVMPVIAHTNHPLLETFEIKGLSNHSFSPSNQ